MRPTGGTKCAKEGVVGWSVKNLFIGRTIVEKMREETINKKYNSMECIGRVEMRERCMSKECKTGLNNVSVYAFNITVLLVRMRT